MLGLLVGLVISIFVTLSLVGVSISLVAALTLIYRILGEEKMLVEELDGYREYQGKVKYRLIPFIW